MTIGAGIWHLQQLENLLAIAIALKGDFKDAPIKTVSIERGQEVLSARQRMTLGQAVNFANRESVFSEELLDRLALHLAERNWLVHRLVEENSDDLYVDGARERLLKRLSRFVEICAEIYDLVMVDLEKFMIAKGMNIDEIKVEVTADLERRQGHRT